MSRDRYKIRFNEETTIELAKLADELNITIPVMARRIVEEVAAQGRLKEFRYKQEKRHSDNINNLPKPLFTNEKLF